MTTYSSAGDAEAIYTLARVMHELEVAELTMPHIVIARASDGTAHSYSGPYSSAVAALEAAEREHQGELAAGGTGEVTFSVAPLYGPVGGLDGTQGGGPAGRLHEVWRRFDSACHRGLARVGLTRAAGFGSA